MDRRKELKDAYKKAKPPMGVLLIRQKEGDAVFLSPAKDLKARQNRLVFQLGAGSHANRRLQRLWNELGPQGFEITVLDTLEYPEDDNGADYGEDLWELCRAHLENYKNGEMIV